VPDGACTDIPRHILLTPIHVTIASHFRDCISAANIDNPDTKIIRNILYKYYLEELFAFCTSLSGPTAEVMTQSIVSFEANLRMIP
jgi:V-type H+-transporting ATPase subunit d